MIATSLAFAKINLSLDIVSRMPDGYHNLATVMQTVSLSDEITINCIPDDFEADPLSDISDKPMSNQPNHTGVQHQSVSVTTNLKYLPGDERNIAAKAASAFFELTGIKGYRTHIDIKKNIPVSAGLGGGSTDGACVLRMLDNMLKTGLGRESLEALGSTIGSDVPFNIDGGTKLAEGRGEKLTDLPPVPHSYIVICKPQFSCSTPELYGLIKCEKIRARPDTCGLIKALEEGDLGGIARRMFNVFEDVLPRGKLDIAEIKSTMLDNAALGTVMTGSGSAVFGLFESNECAQGAYQQLKASYSDCFLTETVGSIYG